MSYSPETHTQYNFWVPKALWARVKARAASEVRPGHDFRLAQTLLQLVTLYADLGIAEILRRCTAPAAPPVDAPAVSHRTAPESLDDDQPSRLP